MIDRSVLTQGPESNLRQSASICGSFSVFERALPESQPANVHPLAEADFLLEL